MKKCLLSFLLCAVCQPLAAGSSFYPNVNISNDTGNHSEVSVSVDPTNPNNLVAATHRLADLTFLETYASADGGLSWKSVPFSDTTDHLGQGMRFDPSVSFDRSGNAYVAYGFEAGSTTLLRSQLSLPWMRPLRALLGFEATTTPSGWVVAWSADKGNTYQTAFVTSPDSTVMYDKFFLVTGPDAQNPSQDDIYLSGTRFNADGSDDIIAFGAQSAGSGQSTISFKSLGVVQNKASVTSGFVQMSDFAVGPQGQIGAVWVDFPGYAATPPAADKTIQFTSAVAGLELTQFDTEKTVASSYVNFMQSIDAQNSRGISPVPSVAIDPKTGTLYVAYTDMDPASQDDTDVKVVHSTDGGATWSTPVLAHSPNNASQFHQWICVDPVTGYLVVAWYDTRQDPTNKAIEIYLSYSADGGNTFAPEVQVSDEPSPQPTEYNQYGDYSGLTAFGGIAHPVWSDARSGVLQTYTASVNYLASGHYSQ